MSSMDNYYNKVKRYSSENTVVVSVIVATLLVLFFINRKINSLETTIKDALFYMATSAGKSVPR